MKRTLIKSVIKLLIVGLLYGCLSHQPYSYYQLVHWAVFVGMAIHAYLDGKDEIYWSAVPAGAIAILFNPISKFYFKRDTWQQIDQVIIGLFIVWIVVEIGVFFIERRKNKKIPI